MPESDIKAGETVISDEEILLPTDQIFNAGARPEINVAIKMILGEQNGYEIPFAAVPLGHHAQIPEQNLFRCLFGRDSLLISGLLRKRLPQLESNVVRALGVVQGSIFDSQSEEEPGRIAHEVREKDDLRAIELAEDGNWKFPYFGAVDATLIWISAIDDLAKSDATELDVILNGKKLWERAADATHWVLTRLETPSGFIESRRSNPQGIQNQVWKDSEDSYMYGDGRLPEGGSTASIETVGETYDALLAAARIQELRPSPSWPMSSGELRNRAKLLRAKLIDSLWLGDRFALGSVRGSNGQQEVLDSQASNQGRLLGSGILDGGEMSDYRQAIALALTDAQLLGPTGLRTLSASHPSYRPGGYHTGSAWPVDGVFAARGLSKHGFHQEALALITRTKESIELIGGYPEFFRGDYPDYRLVTTRITDVTGKNGEFNRVCQPPQMIQGWTVGAYAWINDNIDRISALSSQ